MTEQHTAWDEFDDEELPSISFAEVFVDQLREGPAPVLGVYEVRDDDDYSEPSRRMIVVAPSPEAAEDMWDDPFTEDNVYARPVRLKGWHLEIPGPSRVLYTKWLVPVSQAA